MGLRGEQRPPGLACLLFDSPRDSAERLTTLDAQRLASDLQAAVDYVFRGCAGTAKAGSGSLPLVSDGCIAYEAVAEHVQRAVLAAAGLSLPPSAEQPVGEEEPAGSGNPQVEGQQEQEHQQEAGSNGSDGGSSDGSGSGAQSPGQPLHLAASGAEAASPMLSPGGGAVPADGQLVGTGAAAVRGSGRLGPAEVGLVEARGTCDIDGTRVTSRCAAAPCVQCVQCVQCPSQGHGNRSCPGCPLVTPRRSAAVSAATRAVPSPSLPAHPAFPQQPARPPNLPLQLQLCHGAEQCVRVSRAVAVRGAAGICGHHAAGVDHAGGPLQHGGGRWRQP